jgi:cyclophilin family peptidyl-prolyl cis-trans isomerase
MKKTGFILIVVVLLVCTAAGFFLWYQRLNSVTEVVVLETTKGIIEIELYREHAPLTVDNFVSYVEEGFYNGLVFHRVVGGFVIQAGGFYSNGTYREPYRDPIILESNNTLHNLRGTVAMARTPDPDSATTQFFINDVDNPTLDHTEDFHGYAVFGKVTSGMEVVDIINGVETFTRMVYIIQMPNWPVEDVVIEKAYMK